MGQCDRLMALPKESLEARNYQLAIERMLHNREVCPDKIEIINELIKEAFKRIEREKQTADSALEVANRVLDQMYFYQDKFGLTLKKVGDEYEPQYRYGFIDRQGNEVIPFEFEEATPFSVDDGFARVRKEGNKYLLNTLGVSYLLAESIDELRPETQALDVHESLPHSLPEHLGNYSELQIVLAYGTYGNRGNITSLPKSMGRLKRLQHLNFRYNQLSSLPQEIGQLTQLTKLDLSGNQLRSLPGEIGQLTQLRVLYLRGNQLSSLPEETGQLTQLKELDLWGNQLSSLPKEIGQLTQLTWLYLWGNPLKHLPQFICDIPGLTLDDSLRYELCQERFLQEYSEIRLIDDALTFFFTEKI